MVLPVWVGVSEQLAWPFAPVFAVHEAPPRVKVTVCPAMGAAGDAARSVSEATTVTLVLSVALDGLRLSVKYVTWIPDVQVTRTGFAFKLTLPLVWLAVADAVTVSLPVFNPV